MDTNLFNNSNRNFLKQFSEMNIKNFYSLILLIYFGTKIFNGLLESSPKQPIKNELTNMLMMFMLTNILYYLTNFKESFSNNVNYVFYLFLVGCFLGTLIPNYYEKVRNERDKIQKKNTIYYEIVTISFIFLISFIFNILVNLENNNITSYLIYIVIIFVLILGLFNIKRDGIIRKIYTDNTIFDSNLSEEERKEKEDKLQKLEEFERKNSSKIRFDTGITCWILSLFYIGKSNDIVLSSFNNFFKGLLLSALITNIALYGIEYPLINEKDIRCTDKDDCLEYNVIIDDNNKQNIFQTVSKLKWMGTTLIAVLLVIFIILYLLIK